MSAETPAGRTVILYTQHACEFSEMVRLHLESRGQPYSERNIDDDPAFREELLRFGGQGTPVTVIDGEPVVGYDEDSIDELLGFTPYNPGPET
jgi:glutaredoxin